VIPRLAIEVEGLTKVYGRDVRANAEVDLRVPTGALAALLGPNGAGKTTLVRQVMGLVTPTAGRIRLAGTDVIAHPSVALEMCAYLQQRVVPFPEATVREYVEITARLRGVSRRVAGTVANEEIARWGLGAHRDRRIRKLSGGERRLVGLAATLVAPRPLLLLDEPTNELDPENRARVWQRLAECREAGATVLVITHNVHEIEGLVTHLAVMLGGRVVAQGSPHALREALGHERGRRLRVVVRGVPGDPPPGEGLEWVAEKSAWVGSVERGTVQEIVGDALRRETVAGIRVAEPSLEDVYLGYVAAPGRTEA
jgi:ABC-type multidrug transport system ATPase subunit